MNSGRPQVPLSIARPEHIRFMTVFGGESNVSQKWLRAS